jgi:hypothetical protein
MSRTGRYKIFPVIGLALMAVGLFLLSRMTADTSQASAALRLVVFGAGFGMVSQILTVAIQNSVERRELGIATATANLFRSLGGSVGVAVFGAIFAGRLAGPVDAHSLQSSPQALHAMAPAFRDGVAHAVADALQTVFLVAAPIALVALAVVVFLREVPLRGAHA